MKIVIVLMLYGATAVSELVGGKIRDRALNFTITGAMLLVSLMLALNVKIPSPSPFIEKLIKAIPLFRGGAI